jgi:exodeoxyribonuclease VII small subunit
MADDEESGDSEVGYADALAELESILSELESDTVDVDRLAVQVRRASELIGLCRGRIRDARVEVEQIVADLEEP